MGYVMPAPRGLKGRRTIAQGDALGCGGANEIPAPCKSAPALPSAERGLICRELRRKDAPFDPGCRAA